MWLRGWVTHPLDPLSADEIRTVAGILRREHGVDSGWRFASIEMLEPSKAELRAFEDDGAVPARRATVVCFERTANATYKSVVSLSDGPCRVVRPRPRRTAQLHRRRVRRVRPDVARAPRLPRRAGEPGHHRHRQRLRRHLDLRRRRRTAGVPRPPDRVVGHLAQGRARHEPVRPSRQLDCTASSTSTRWNCCGSKMPGTSKRLR